MSAISQKLKHTSSENRLGHNNQSKVGLNRANNLHLIGWYAVEIYLL